ncbi:MAG: hypothetical protein HON14_06340 [Rhodospirillaceae bacterium]|jgi:hypothetical protein|nr:hypothetical protein [Rhodospirillaceae bacterium]MBT4589978.1 hypothetical protein [Rhodospirillaceae bacterium]MBT4938732.1 hypothetical protein [Rhodospirillaceae bacterium]MBT5938582.1 hypothetical protein [Rhodospirillaceae bacterium]MBT7265308.1 hypothetical protein [Rhodospirillaceae bacterium]
MNIIENPPAPRPDDKIRGSTSYRDFSIHSQNPAGSSWLSARRELYQMRRELIEHWLDELKRLFPDKPGAS